MPNFMGGFGPENTVILWRWHWKYKKSNFRSKTRFLFKLGSWFEI